MSHRLTSYLRTHRKKAGFSQADLAFLLGLTDGAHVSRYERSARRPNFTTVFACQIIFAVTAPELLPELTAGIERSLIERAQRLLARLGGQRRTPLVQRKIDRLRAILAGVGAEPRHNP